MDMRGRSVLRRIQMKPLEPMLFSILLLAVCFLLGALIGYVYSGVCDEAARTALSDYLRDYCQLSKENTMDISLLRCIALYFGYVTAVFLFGFSSLGIFLIPVLASTFGFSLMYTISCFVHTFARAGILPAAALLVIRLIFTMPCFFWIGSEAWIFSKRLMVSTISSSKHREPIQQGSWHVLIFFICVVILSVGIFCERVLTPILFRFAVRGIA